MFGQIIIEKESIYMFGQIIEKAYIYICIYIWSNNRESIYMFGQIIEKAYI